ncbi:MAG: acetyl-CoA carboxylase biotin carboxyl carrier protein, partial [candidate division NC10 bacterium]
MDSEIKELMEYIEASSFVEFELEREGFKIKLVKRSALTNGAAGSASPAAQAVLAAAVTQVAEAPGPRPAVVESPDVHLVKSPIVGTFYRAGSPTARSFVEVGDRVKKGQVLCIIAAMKLMNAIESAHHDPARTRLAQGCFAEADRALGTMLDYAKKNEAAVLIVSDHGHGSLEGKI